MSTNEKHGAPALPKRFLTEAEVAQVTGLSTKTLRSWRSRRKGPPFTHLHGAVRYPVDLLDAWCAAQMVQTAA